MNKLRLAIVGGGAIADTVYLPVLATDPNFAVACLVETNMDQAASLRDKFKIPVTFSSLEAMTGHYDAAVVALPNYLHKQASVSLLKKGIHVLVEKPMALRAADCREMQHIARTHNVSLMVGMVRRYYPNVQHIKELISTNSMGFLKHIKIHEGYVFNWPVTSDSLINLQKSGGGVFMDVGVHVIDMLFYWLGKPDRFEYYDDSPEHVEAECLAKGWWGNIEVTIALSRLRTLSNNITLEFEKGTVVTDIKPANTIRISFPDQQPVEDKFMDDMAPDKLRPFRKQLNDFAELIRAGVQPVPSNDQACAGIELIEKCYKEKQRLELVSPHF